ncbi:MAG: hypothetical protein IJF65_04355 [Clostridia bacterium]|nr:hypothetical protein [Clostridia bacterium]
MRASIRRLVVIICLFCFWGSSTALAANEYTLQADGYELVMWQMDWDSFDHTHSAFQTPEALLSYVEDCVDQIVELTGNSNWMGRYSTKQIRIATTTRGSYANSRIRPTIYLNINWLSSDMAPIIHELGHIVAPIDTSRSLEEGFNTYLQFALNGMPSVHSFGMDPHLVMQNILRNHPLTTSDFLSSIGALELNSSYAFNQATERSAFYVASHSFVNYLIDTYGFETFWNLSHSNSKEAYQLYTGKALETLQQDWLVYLKTEYTADFTLKDFEASLYDTLIEHGWTEDLASQAAPGFCKQLAP